MPESSGDEREASQHDADPQRQLWSSHETLLERQIRQAVEEGKFDNLPHQGEPLPNDENPHAGEWGLAFHVLRNAGFAPPWIEADKEVRTLLARRDAILARVGTGPAPSQSARRRDRLALERLVAEINASVATVNAGAPSLRQHRQPLALADELARYDEVSGRAPSGDPALPQSGGLMTKPGASIDKRPRMPPGFVIRAIWAVHRAIYRWTGGRRGLWRATPGKWGTFRLHTIGRKSGKERIAILGYHEDGPNTVTVAMNGWMEGDPGWWVNLQANPDATIELKGQTLKVKAHAAAGEERERLWALFPDNKRFVDNRKTETAIVVLEPMLDPS